MQSKTSRTSVRCASAFLSSASAIAALVLIASPLSAQLTINNDLVVGTDADPGGQDWDYTDGEISIGSGSGESGSLTVPAGEVVNTMILNLGAGAADASGYLEINGAGAAVNSSVDVNATGDSEFNIGLNGFGEVLVTNGGTINRRTLYVGTNAGSVGIMTVTGEGSSLAAPGNWTLRIGQLGTGTVNLLDGATSAVNQLFIGNINDGTDSGPDYTNAGNGTLLIGGGAVMTTNSSTYIGNRIGTEGHVTVTGEGSVLDVDTFMHVGSGGDGTLIVENAGAVSIGSSFSVAAAQRAGEAEEEPVASVHLSGAGSSLDVGTWANVGRGSEGSIQIDNEATFQTGSYFYVGGDDGSTGTMLAESGATINVGSHFRTGRDAGSTGTATIRGAGTTLEAGQYIHIGSDGDGTLIVEDGASVITGTDTESTNSALSVASASGSTGHLEVNGENSSVLVQDSFFYVGRGGDGTAVVSDGGSITVADADMRIGREVGSTGEVTVTGAGSEIVTASFIQVGGEGDGTLQVLDGGRVENTDSTFSVARGTGTTGILNVSGGGSEVVSASNVLVGREGDGTANVTDGGLFSTGGDFLIGHGAVATGLVSVSGSGSSVSADGGIWIGADSEPIDPEEPELGEIFIATGGAGSLALGAGGQATAQEGVVVRGAGNSIFINGGTLTTAAGLDMGDETVLEFFLGSLNFGGIEAQSIFFDGTELDIQLGFQPELNDVFVLVENTGLDAIDGFLSFAGVTLSEGDQFTVTDGAFSQLFAISYEHDGNNLALTAIPEPSTWALLAGLSAFALILIRRRNS